MNDNNILEQAQKICRNLLDLNLPETPEKINDAIEKVRLILPSLTEEDRNTLLERLIAATGVTQDAPRILDDNKIEPWILDKWANNPENRQFWRRYRDFLTDTKKIPSKVVARLDELTDTILDRLADPEKHDQFDKRGLVVGHVQSGKTSNYIGLINKAADAGYRLIVVLAGIHNSLRSQTQLRIDEGFLGYDTEITRSLNQSSSRIGVGLINRKVPAISLTSNAPNGDFKKSVADTVNFGPNTSDPVVVVIKKNNSVLKNLIDWLAHKGDENEDGERIIRDTPLLLIDDEADNASINISKDSVSAINGSIRAILQLFSKSAYVGYTATPYANVFMPIPRDVKNSEEENLLKGIRVPGRNRNYPVGEDLFPRNFIINIPPPSNYIGPEKFFGIISEEVLYESEEDSSDRFLPINLYIPVNDYQPIDYKSVAEDLRKYNDHYIPDKHKKDDAKPSTLPDSLKEAIQCFIISCAARRARGQVDVHNSMLIHVTRFVDWQNAIAVLVGEELAKYQKRIEFNNQDFLGDLKNLWERDYIHKTDEVIKYLENNKNSDPDITLMDWKDVEVHLLSAVTKIRLRAVHGSSRLGGLEVDNLEPLDYYDRKKGFSVIAVGGNKLSRGLTLEGLTVSYYLRSSKMYDTLMQMGRWFGYRPGYLDLCRLYTSHDIISHYKHITLATEEMRAEFDRMTFMSRKQPIDFGLKVRAHTGVLSITASNKFRYRKMMKFSFSGGLEETWKFDIRKNDIFQNNHEITKTFINKLGSPTDLINSSPYIQSQKFVWSQKDNYNDIITYLKEYKSVQESFYPKLLSGYIEKQATLGNLTNWTIVLINNSRASAEKVIKDYGGLNVGLSSRRNTARNKEEDYDLAKAHIIGNFHEYIDLNDSQLEKALNETRDDNELIGKDPAKTIHPSPLRIRLNRPESNGLLLIYPLDPSPDGNDAYSECPIVGLALSFPYVGNDEGVLYAVNEVFQKELDYPDNYDNEDYNEESEEDTNIGSSSRIIDYERILRSFDFIDDDFAVDIEDLLKEASKVLCLDDVELKSGIVPNYSHSDDPESELEYRQGIVVPNFTKISNREIRQLPYYTDKEIQRYYLNENTENKILLPNEDSIVTGKYVVGVKDSKYVIFSYHEGEAAFSDASWIIHSERFPPKYLVSVLNSTLFGAWTRVKGKQKKDTYFIERPVLNSFPIITPLEEDVWLYENLYDLLVVAGNQEREIGKGTMFSYYSSIIDSLIFCLYYRDSMIKEFTSLYSELSKTIPKTIPQGRGLEELTRDVFKKLYDKTNPVKETLFYFDDNPKVKMIKSVFTQNAQ